MILNNHSSEGTVNPLSNVLENKASNYQPYMVGFSALVLIILMVNTAYFSNTVSTDENFSGLYHIISYLFLTELIYRFYSSDNKKGFFKDWSNIADLILCLPFYSLPWMITTATLRSLKIIVFFVLNNITTAFTSMMILSVSLILFATISIMQFENIEACNIKNTYDAIWWSICTITTVGFGDKFPVTEGGKMVAIILMILGIGLFGALVGYISNFFTDKEKDNNKEIDTIEELSRQIECLRKLIEDKDKK